MLVVKRAEQLVSEGIEPQEAAKNSMQAGEREAVVWPRPRGYLTGCRRLESSSIARTIAFKSRWTKPRLRFIRAL